MTAFICHSYYRTLVRLSLLYYLFPVPVFSKTEAGGRSLLIINYVNEPMHSGLLIFKYIHCHGNTCKAIISILVVSHPYVQQNRGGEEVNINYLIMPMNQLMQITFM